MVAVYERIAVARPEDATLGPVRARMPRQVAEMRRMRARGASMDDIAAAYGVSKRTVYRYLAAGVTEHVVGGADGARPSRSAGAVPWRVSRWGRA